MSVCINIDIELISDSLFSALAHTFILIHNNTNMPKQKNTKDLAGISEVSFPYHNINIHVAGRSNEAK